MNEPIKVCPTCNTANQPDYNFCKNCGLPLGGTSSNVPPQYTQYNPQVPPQYNNQAPPQSGYVVEEIDGVPTQHIAAYVGNNQKIMNRFMELHLTGEKSSWCWPVFILGLFFGLVGVSGWFFYRKIYKPAVALLIAGVLILGLSFAITFAAMGPNIKEMISTVQNSVDKLASGEITEEQYMSDIYGTMFSGNYMIATTITSAIGLVQFVAQVILAMYAFTFYKRSATQRIKAYALKMDREVYPVELQKVGGTSPGLIALVLVGYFVITLAVSLAVMLPMLQTIFNSLQ